MGSLAAPAKLHLVDSSSSNRHHPLPSYAERPIYTHLLKPPCSIQLTQVEEISHKLSILPTRPHITVYNSLLRNAGDNRDLATGRLLHAHILEMGYLPDLFLANLLIQMYGKCGTVDDAYAVFSSMHQTNVFSWTLLVGALINASMLDHARHVFDHMPEHDVTSWNSMIASYSQNDRDRDALELFDAMQIEGCCPDSITFVSILTACTHVRDLSKCREMHASIVSWGLEEDQDLRNPLINMYNKCGSVEDTENVFNKLAVRSIFAWNAVIAVLVREGYVLEAFHYYSQMPLHGKSPDDVTFITLLGAFDSQDDLSEGKQIHACIVRAGVEQDVMLGTALISMYGRCGSIMDAQRVFNGMCKHNVISWNALISVYAQNNHEAESLAIFQEMEVQNIQPNKVTFVNILDVCASLTALAEGKRVHARLSGSSNESDYVIMTALLNMYGTCGSLEDAQGIFDAMMDRDLISWNALMAAYVHNEIFDKACSLFQEMQRRSIRPDEATFANALTAYANQFEFDNGKDLHACIVSEGFEADTMVGNSLINFYNKSGRMQDAWVMFNKLPEHDIVSWNAMISTYSQHGHVMEAFSLFQEMQFYGNQPNEVTFLSILTAFSHSGLVDQGCACFFSMLQVFSAASSAEHYNVMVDLFGRTGRLDDAEGLINEMPMKSDVTTWMGLLSACRIHVDFHRGIHSAARL